MSEKIFSRKAGRRVHPGEYLMLDVDVALGNDITAPVAINEFRKAGGKNFVTPTVWSLFPTILRRTRILSLPSR